MDLVEVNVDDRTPRARASADLVKVAPSMPSPNPAERQPAPLSGLTEQYRIGLSRHESWRVMCSARIAAGWVLHQVFNFVKIDIDDSPTRTWALLTTYFGE